VKIGKKEILCFLFAALIGAVAQPLAAQQNQKKGLEYQISVSSISIAVTVQDKGGKYINDLTGENFTIYENNVKQDISYFKHDFAAPLSLTVLLDVSGSMALQDKLKESKDELRHLLTSRLSPQDEVSLLIFADGEVEVASRFSTDKSNDAVAVSPEFAKKGGNEKRALLLITDGIENDSQSTPDQAVDIARRVDVPIYTIGYKIPLNEQFLRKYKRSDSLTSSGIAMSLEQFSQATGGKAFIVNTADELDAALAEIHRELGHQYILGYTSYRTSKEEYRKIRVVTSNKKHKVRTRQGY